MCLCVCVYAEPRFVAAHLIPDSADRDDDKIYFFFTERATETTERDDEGAIHTRIGRLCAVRQTTTNTIYIHPGTSRPVYCNAMLLPCCQPHKHSCWMVYMPLKHTHTHTHSTITPVSVHTHTHR